MKTDNTLTTMEPPKQSDKQISKIAFIDTEVVENSGKIDTIMHPISQTSKITFLISAHYDAFGNCLSPFGVELLTG